MCRAHTLLPATATQTLKCLHVFGSPGPVCLHTFPHVCAWRTRVCRVHACLQQCVWVWDVRVYLCMQINTWGEGVSVCGVHACLWNVFMACTHVCMYGLALGALVGVLTAYTRGGWSQLAFHTYLTAPPPPPPAQVGPCSRYVSGSCGLGSLLPMVQRGHQGSELALAGILLSLSPPLGWKSAAWVDPVVQTLSGALIALGCGQRPCSHLK